MVTVIFFNLYYKIDKPTRPAFRYYGGKWMLAPWIISHLPKHEVYVEPFGGAASVLVRKPPSKVEIYNDLNEELVNFFKILRNEYTAKRLVNMLNNTPFSRVEFNTSYLPSSFNLERARRLAVRALMGYGATGASRMAKTGFRYQMSQGRSATRDYMTYPESLKKISERLRSVVIENIDAMKLIERFDVENACFYVDPPYIWGTRSKNAKHQGYKYEMSDEAHIELLGRLKKIKGSVLLSAYEHPLYDQHLKSWRKVTKPAYALNAAPRKEVLWIKN